MTFTTSVSGGSVRDSPATTLFEPVEVLVLYFLGTASSGRRRNCTPGFVMSVGAILAGPRRRRQTRLTSEFRTLVCPMTGFSALVAIALFVGASVPDAWDWINVSTLAQEIPAGAAVTLPKVANGAWKSGA